MEYCVVVTTCGSRDEAEKIAKSIINKRLAACVQLSNISSYYIWNNEVMLDAEVKLLIKTRNDLYKELEEYILSIHPYEIPEIIKLTIEDGSESYLGWIDEVTR